jgi:ABC-2 type transport system permease protein
MGLVHNLRDFSKYPLTIYALPIRILLTWIVPFAFTGFFPATFLLERKEFYPYVYLIPVVSVVFFSLAYAFWRAGVNAYQSTGS